MKNCIFLARYRKNTYYSFASLLPVLSKNFPDAPIQLIKEKEGQEIAEKILNSLKNFQTIFYFDSFMSVDVPIVQKEMRVIFKRVSNDMRNSFFPIAGGAHPTAAPLNTLDLGFKAAAIGEGEKIIEILVRTVLSKGDWKQIPGIVYNDQGFINKTKNPPKILLDDYQPYCEAPPIHPPIELMRGCSFGCKFCQTPRVLRSIRYRSIDSIDRIVSYYYQKFKHRSHVDIRFIAPNSLEYGSKDHRTPNLEALWSLVKTVKKYPVRMFLGSFPSEVRPEFVTPETVEVLQQSDSNIVAIGAQSGNEEMLTKMNRGHSLSDITNCVQHLLDGGLIPQLDFILGLPEEPISAMLDTVKLIENLCKKRCQIRLHGYLPLPGTPYADAKPSQVPSSIKKELGALMNQYKISGAFIRQLDLAMPIFSYR